MDRIKYLTSFTQPFCLCKKGCHRKKYEYSEISELSIAYRMKCGVRIAASDVKTLFKEFWGLNSHNKRMYISSFLQLRCKNAYRPIFDDAMKSHCRYISITFKIQMNEEIVPICKADFPKCFEIT